MLYLHHVSGTELVMYLSVIHVSKGISINAGNTYVIAQKGIYCLCLLPTTIFLKVSITVSSNFSGLYYRFVDPVLRTKLFSLLSRRPLHQKKTLAFLMHLSPMG